MIEDFKLGENHILQLNYKNSSTDCNELDDFFWIEDIREDDSNDEVDLSQNQMYYIYKLVQNYKCGREIKLTTGVFKCCSDCFIFEDKKGKEICVAFGDETARLKDWIYNTLKELGYEKFNEKTKGEVVKSIEIESNTTSVIRLDDVKYFYVDEDGLQNILKDKEVFKRYELQIGLTIAKKGILWIVTPIKK